MFQITKRIGWSFTISVSNCYFFVKLHIISPREKNTRQTKQHHLAYNLPKNKEKVNIPGHLSMLLQCQTDRSVYSLEQNAPQGRGHTRKNKKVIIIKKKQGEGIHTISCQDAIFAAFHKYGRLQILKVLAKSSVVLNKWSAELQ